jgi:ribosomal protein L13E
MHPINCIGRREDIMWNRRDWDEFFDIVRKRWHAHRPPRPVDLSRRNRLTPAEGYSLAELDDAGLSIEQAEHLGLPVDAGRVGSYGPNVSTLRDYIRATRSRF